MLISDEVAVKNKCPFDHRINTKSPHLRILTRMLSDGGCSQDAQPLDIRFYHFTNVFLKEKPRICLFSCMTHPFFI